MILISQDGNEQINFDNVNRLYVDDYELNQIKIVVEFTNGVVTSIGTFKDKEYGLEVFQDLLMDYRGNAIVEVPKDKIKDRTAGTVTVTV